MARILVGTLSHYGARISQGMMSAQQDTIRRYLELGKGKSDDSSSKENQCLVAYNARELLEMTEGFQPDVIVLSYRSEEAASMEALHMLRQSERGRETPIVMTTTSVLPSSIVTRFTSICDAFLDAAALERGDLRSAVERVRYPRSPVALVVEDDEDMRRIIVRTLQQTGFNATPFQFGQHALGALLSGTKYDLVVSGLMLRDIYWKGPAVVGVIRAINPFLPVIIISGDLNHKEVTGEMSLEQLFGAHLMEKPFETIALQTTAVQMLPKRLRPQKPQ